MSERESPPDARPAFRKLAVAVAIVCFLLAGISGWVGEVGLTVPIICLFVGVMMAVIGVTGSWPPRK